MRRGLHPAATASDQLRGVLMSDGDVDESSVVLSRVTRFQPTAGRHKHRASVFLDRQEIMTERPTTEEARVAEISNSKLGQDEYQREIEVMKVSTTSIRAL